MEKNTEETKGQFAVVTGASTGIGYELAKIFVQHGYDVLAVAHSVKDLSEFGAQVQAVQADLATREGVEKVFEAVRAKGHPVDALVLNAGVGVNGDFVRENSLEDELNLINLNITSVVHLSKLVLPAMVERGKGRVLITSSIAALMPGPFYSTYAASKSFLLSFAEGLHNELKDSGVTVTALMPGATDTEFFRTAGMEDTPAGQAKKDDPAKVAEQGFKAMLAGDDHIIAGSVMNKIQGFTTKFLSQQQQAEIHRKQIEPESHQKH